MNTELDNQEYIVREGIKVNSSYNDGHRDHSKCLVLAESMESQLGFLYLVLFKDYEIPIVVADFKIKLLPTDGVSKLKLKAEQSLYLQNIPKEFFNYYKDQKDEKNTAKNQIKENKQD